MYKKPQRHHYETSKRANYISFISAVVIFSLIMFYFVVLRGRPFDLSYANRVFAVGAVFLIGLSYLLGPLARFFSKRFVHKLEYRKPLGLYGYLFSIIHILVSLLIISGEELGSNSISLFFGMNAIIIFSFVAATSMVKSIEAFGFEKWQKIQRMGYLAFILVILHFSILGSGEFINRQLGQITLVFASLVILLRILALFIKKKPMIKIKK